MTEECSTVIPAGLICGLRTRTRTRSGANRSNSMSAVCVASASSKSKCCAPESSRIALAISV